MRLTSAAITAIINNLASQGLVHEIVDGLSTMNRRPVLLEIKPSRGYLVGVDIGTNHSPARFLSDP